MELSDQKHKKITSSNSLGFTWNTSTQDRYVMLVFSRWRTSAVFLFLKTPKRAREPKLTGSRLLLRISVRSSLAICLYLVCLRFTLLPAFTGLSVSFAALPQIWGVQSCSAGVSDWTFILDCGSQSHYWLSHPGSTAEIPWPCEEHHNEWWANEAGGLPLTVAFKAAGSSI